MKRVRFTAVGCGPFPMDMLRYDGCYPLRSEDVVTLSNAAYTKIVVKDGVRSTVTDMREVKLESRSEQGVPTQVCCRE